jgi:hypothetical protein
VKPPACGGGQVAPCLPDPNNPYISQYVRFTGNSQIIQNDYKMFGPRFGFAYQVQPSMVIRGGFGIFYDLEAGVMQTAQNASGAWPRTDLIRGVNVNRPTITSLADDTFNGTNPRIPLATPATAQAFFYDPNYRNPYSEQWNFEIQKELGSNMTFSAGYVGSHGSRLDIGGFYNTALTPGPGPTQPRALFPWATATNYDSQHRTQQLSCPATEGRAPAFRRLVLPGPIHLEQVHRYRVIGLVCGREPVASESVQHQCGPFRFRLRHSPIFFDGAGLRAAVRARSTMAESWHRIACAGQLAGELDCPSAQRPAVQSDHGH